METVKIIEGQPVVKNDHRSSQETFRKHARDMKLWQYYSWWIDNYKVGHIAAVTLVKYRLVDHWLKFNVPGMKLGDLEDNRMLLQWLIDKYGKTHQKATVLDFKGHIFTALRSAVDDRLITNIATSQISVHSVEETWSVGQKNAKRHQVKSLDESEYRLFKTRVYIDLEAGLKVNPIRNINRSPFKHGDTETISNQTKLMLISFLLHTGARFSEALGITEGDIHSDSVTINKTWDYKTNTGFKKTKNDASIRNVAVDETLIKELKMFLDWKKRCFGPTPDLPILVEPNTLTYNSTYNDFLKSLLKKYEIKKSLSIHKLRHTYISVLLNNGINPEMIAKQVGHTDTSMIQKVYGHLLAERAEEDKMRIRSLLR